MRQVSDRTAGFTVIELLIASVILLVVLGGLTSYLVTSRQAMGVTEQLSDRQQEVEAAVNVMSYDLSLAGYRGTTPDDFARTFGTSTLLVEKEVDGGESDRLTLRYYEDSARLYGADDTCGSPCLVTYEVGTEDDGLTYLLRQEGGATERGIVQRVEYFRVIQYIQRDGSLVDITSANAASLPSDLAGLNIEIAFSTGGLWRFPVGISNVQE